MDYLPNIKLIESEDFELYTYKVYEDDFLNRLSIFFNKKKKNILQFFNLSHFRKIRINLFDTKEKYMAYSTQHINISPYSTGNCCQGMVNYVCNDSDLLDFGKAGFLIASVMHEFVHLVYNEQVSPNCCVWLEEGLAQYLSGQKSFLESDSDRYNNWLQNQVLEKEIPPIDYLKKHGGNYGEFCDIKTNKYNGYDIAYALIHYLVENYTNSDICELAKNPNKLEIMEKHIMQDFMNEYKRT